MRERPAGAELVHHLASPTPTGTAPVAGPSPLGVVAEPADGASALSPGHSSSFKVEIVSLLGVINSTGIVTSPLGDSATPIRNSRIKSLLNRDFLVLQVIPSVNFANPS